MLKREAEIFGLLFLRDGDRTSWCLLLNILASEKIIPVAVLEIVDCQGHLADGNKNMERSFVINFWILWKKLTEAKN